MGERRGLHAELDRPRETCGHGGTSSGDLLPGCVHQGSGPRDGRRVIRGGSWNNKPENLRASNRNRNNADNRNNNIGFRLVQSARTVRFTRRPGAGLFMDRPGEAAGVHEPASRPSAQAETPKRGPGVRRSEPVGSGDSPDRCTVRIVGG